jgi:hypothetical protein
MIMVLVISVINDKNVSTALRYLSSALIILSLIVSFTQYRDAMTGFAYDPSWPQWKAEVSRWRTYHAYPIKIWPSPWQIILSDTPAKP